MVGQVARPASDALMWLLACNWTCHFLPTYPPQTASLRRLTVAVRTDCSLCSLAIPEDLTDLSGIKELQKRVNIDHQATVVVLEQHLPVPA